MERRIEFMVVSFIVAVAQSDGARLLDDDLSSHKNSISFDPNLGTVLENRDPPVTHSDGASANSLHQNTITTEILQQESVQLDQKKHTFLLNKLPSGPSPGVGHMATNTNGHIERAEQKSPAAFHISPSGPSPGGGHSFPVVQSITLNKLPSGPSPGVGHSIPNSQADKFGIKEESVTLNKLPSGPSPGSGNSHVESVKTESEKSLGVGQEQTYPFHVEKQNINAGKKPSSSIKPQSGPSPGVGHGFETDNTKKSTHAAVTNVPLGSIKASSASGPRIGCANPMEGVGQASGSFKLFDDSSIYGAPTSAMFGIAGIGIQS